MMTTVQINSELWKKFSVLAQQKRKRPELLLENLLAEYLAIQKDLQLDDAIREQARPSGLKENNAVELVKLLRQKRPRRFQ
jgi:predicted transcriptional regulator